MTYDLISVVLPVYKQADHLHGMVAAHEESLGKIPVPHELLLLVNGPDDGTLEEARQLAQEFDSVRVVESRPAGWGLAVRRGLEETRGDLLCFTNSARTSSQDLTLLLLYAVAYPGVVIKASRKVRESWTRRLGSLLYNLECRMLFDLSSFDVNGTPKVFPRSFDHLLALTRDDDLIDAEFNAICRQQEYPMLEVPMLSTRRHGGKSTTNYESAVKMYWGAYELWRQTRRPGEPPSADLGS